jgi:hypothetical protein
MRHALAFIAAYVGIAGLWPSLAAAQPQRQPQPHGGELAVTGSLTTEVTPCSSLCTESEWAGRLDGTSRFTLISLEDAQIPNENISRFHGNLVLSTPAGDLLGEDHGIWNLDTGQYVDLYTVTSGTGEYAGATAIILLWGTLDPVTGEGLSRYQGLIILKQRR